MEAAPSIIRLFVIYLFVPSDNEAGGFVRGFFYRVYYLLRINEPGGFHRSEINSRFCWPSLH